MIRTISVLVLCAFVIPVQAAIYKCKIKGKIEYRDTPCYYQGNNSLNEEEEINVKGPRKSGSNINLSGSWCQYATAQSKSGRKATHHPYEWYFKANGYVEVKSKVDRRLPAIVAKYTLSNDFLQIRDEALGSWFVKRVKNDELTLNNTQSGYRYLKPGRCN